MCFYKHKGKERKIRRRDCSPEAAMGSVKAEKSRSLKNPKNKGKKPLAPTNLNNKKFKKPRIQNPETNNNNNNNEIIQKVQLPASASEQLSCFLNQFQSANGVQLSSLELESLKGTATFHYAPFGCSTKSNTKKQMIIFFWLNRYLHCGVISRHGPGCWKLGETYEGSVWGVMERSALWKTGFGRKSRSWESSTSCR